MSGERVRDLGEFDLITVLAASLPASVRTSASVPVGIGDDAAVWQPPSGESLLLSTDTLVEGVHYRLEWTDWEGLGWKALAVNLSDIAAMGGDAHIALISLALTGDERISDLQNMYRGVGSLADQYGVVIAGGDVVRSPGAMTISVTIGGATRDGHYLGRSGTQDGDLIMVSGTLGAAAAGLQLLQLPPGDPRKLAATAGSLILAQQRPRPRLELGKILLLHGATSGMDLSDGLFGDLPKLLVASGVNARLYREDIPVAAAIRSLFPETWFELATRGGEDYELLFTAPPSAEHQLRKAAALAGSTISVIGTVQARNNEFGQMALVDSIGNEDLLAGGAWDHFG